MSLQWQTRFTRDVARLFTLSVVLAASQAHASPLLDLAGDTGSNAGLQARTVPGGSGAAYFNPALLVDGPAEATVGFMLFSQHMGVTLYGRPGTEFAIPEGLTSAVHGMTGKRFDNYGIPTNWLQLGRMETARNAAFLARPRQQAGSGHGIQTYELIGLVVKLFEGKVGLGVHGYVPNGEFTKLRAFFNDEREQYFSNSLHPELYSDRLTAVSFGFGLGVQLAKRFSIGVGATLGLQANVVAPTYVTDTGNLGSILIDMNASVNIGITPHFGLSYKPTDRLRLTATAHAPQKVELGTSFTFLLSTGVEQTSGVTFVLDYTPWQLAVGGSYDLIQSGDKTLTAAATLLYATWSNYVDRHGERPLPAYAWSDTLSPTLGLRFHVGGLSTVLDVSYVPTPVPLQTGRTNYVDNDRITGTLGAEYRFQAWGTGMRLGLQGQLHSLVTRHQTKLRTPTSADGINIAPERVKDELPDDAEVGGEPVTNAAGLQTNNPGWPGFSSGGFVLGGTIYFALSL
ncbi:MAG: hypothetical protein ABW321_06310 [Polyangiales bacterium]